MSRIAWLTLVLSPLWLSSTGCSGLKEWLNKEPEIFQKSKTTEPEPRTGIAAELNDVEYAEYQKMRESSEEGQRRSQSRVFGF